jgi:hemerythrin
MTFIEWTDSMSVGSPVLDGHHQMIIDCLNRLHPLIGAENRAEPDRMRAILDTLEDFVLVHFSEEERAMRQAGYPDWRDHKDQHDRMYDMVFAMKSDVEHGRDLDAAQLFDILNTWLVGHILGEDRKYMPYLEHPLPDAPPLWGRANGRPY